MTRLAWVIAIALCAIGCAKSSRAAPDEIAEPQDDGGALSPDAREVAEPEPCDPYALQLEPIDVGSVMGAGKDAEGTSYVVSSWENGAGYQLFMTEGGPDLVRKRIAMVGGAAWTLELTVTDHTPPFRLLVNTEALSTMAGMYLTHVLEGPGHPVSREGEQLKPLGRAGLRALTWRSVPGRSVFEHGASLDDGRVMIVTRPEEDWSYDDFRVFVGPLDQLVERLMYSASRGATTYIEFDLDGQQVEAEFHSELSGGAKALLWIGDEMLPMTLLDEPPPGARYECTR